MNTYKRALLFIALLFLLSGALSHYFLNVVTSDTGLASRDRWFYEGTGKDIKYLILGDSHSFFGIDPSTLDPSGRSYNLAANGKSYIHTYYMLKYIFEDDIKRIDNIVLQLDLHDLSSLSTNERLMRARSYFWSKHLDYIELSRETGKWLFFSQLALEGHLAPYLSGYKYFVNFFDKWWNKERSLSYLFHGSTAIPRGNGYMARKGDYSKADDKLSPALARSRLMHEGYVPYDKTLITYLEKIIELCRDHKVKLRLVSMPITRTFYRSSLAVIKTEDEDFDEYYMVNRIKEKYGLKFYDFRSFFFDHDEMFWDQDHLNVEGSEIFSRTFGELLEKDSI